MASPSTNIGITATDKTGKAFRAVNKNVSGMQKGVTALKGAFVGLASVMAAKAFVNFVSNQLKAADAMGKMATKLQISTTALQTFRFAGEQSGETTQTMDNNLIKFAKNLGEAQTGIGLAKRELEILGISLKDSSGNFKSHEEILSEVADAYKNMDNPARKMASAMALFGRSGHVMVNMLSDGADGLALLRDGLIKSGGIIENDFIVQAEDANDAMNRLSKTFGAITTVLLSDLAPAILRVTEGLMGLMDIDPYQGRGAERLGRDLEKVNRELGEAQQKAFAMQKEISESNAVMNAFNARHAQLAGLQGEIAILVERRAKIQKHLAKFTDDESDNVSDINEELEKQNAKLKEQQLIQKHATQARFMGATKVLGAQQQVNKTHEDLLDLIEEEYSSDFIRLENDKVLKLEEQNEKIKEQKRLKEEADKAEEKAQAILDKNHAKQKRDAEDKERIRKQLMQQTVATARQTGDILYEQGLMGFDAMRALAFTEAMVNAHLSATKALATLVPPWSYAAAAASYAYAASRAYEIKNMKPPAREMGGTVTKGKPFLVGESGAEIFTPGQTGSITPNMGGVTNINFNIRANDASGFDSMLQDRRGMIVSMINQSLHSQGRKGML